MKYANTIQALRSGASAALLAAAAVAIAAPADAGEKLLYSFKGSDGANPVTPLIGVNSLLYSTTWGGGAAGAGVVFSFDPTTGVETPLRSFAGGSDGSGGTGLIYVHGKLYGTTWAGGTGGCKDTGAGTGCGTVFSVNLDGKHKSLLHSFQGGPSDGWNPQVPTYINHRLYGTTTLGGSAGPGTLFSVNLDGTDETVLHSFGDHSGDGAYPSASLIKVGKKLYGTTYDGGAYNNCGGLSGCGTVFSANLDGTHEKVLHSFGNGTDGQWSTSDLIEVNGLLYGTTEFGGTGGCNCGTVFSIDPKTGVENVIYSFKGAPNDGALPVYSGVTYANGKLYGVTSHGGSGSCPGGSCGTVFSVNLDGSGETLAYSFKSESDGRWPEADLVNVDGTLYGTTFYGGAFDNGVLFSVTP